MIEKYSEKTVSPRTLPADERAIFVPAVAKNDSTNTAASEATTYTADTILQGNLKRGTLSSLPICSDAVAKISDYAPEMARAGSYFYEASKKAGADQIRNQTIVMRLLQAVAYGMESKEANEDVRASDAGNLFKSHLFAKDLLIKSPEFLLLRSDVTDWAGRTFKNITGFEYALWAKDFKMMEMMFHCIPETEEGDAIRTALLEQYKQVTAPTYAGGGLTYTHIYDLPNLDASGIPNGTTTHVAEVRTENHFDIKPLCHLYEIYDANYDTRHQRQNEICWAKLIGAFQLLLPVHILQRYCDPNSPFYPLPQSNSKFQRSTNFYNCATDRIASLFGSTLSVDFALARGELVRFARGVNDDMEWTRLCGPLASIDSEAISKLDQISTIEIEKISWQLSQPRYTNDPCPPR